MAGAPTFKYSQPTKVGKIPFTPPGTDRQCETAYFLWGDLASEKHPLIILHGGPGAPSRDFKPLTILNDKLGIPVLMYDQLGCGESTHLRDTRGDVTFWTQELFLAELDNLKKHLNIEKFDLLGHSCGGQLAAKYALTQPKGLRKLIIASAGASDELRVQVQGEQQAALPQEMKDVMERCEREGTLDDPAYGEANNELMRRHCYRSEPWPAELLECWKLLEEDDTVGFTMFGGVGRKTTGSGKHYNVISQLPEITEKTAPGGVLLTNGRYDMSSDKSIRPLFTGIRARVKWMQFADSAHFPHLEEFDAYYTALSNFLTTE